MKQLCTILLVEDDPYTLESIVDGLKFNSPGQYDIHTAGNAPEAISQIQEKEFDVVVTDLKMPSNEYEGFQVIRAVQGVDPYFDRTQVIIMTVVGADDRENAFRVVRKALQMGVVDYILKDWRNDIELLDKTIQKILLEKQQGIERSVIRPGQVFVACPFDDHHNNLCRQLSNHNSNGFFNFIRADDAFHGKHLKDTIHKQISESEFVVAMISGQNPNVLYELGLAHGMGKRVVLVKDQETEEITDLKSIQFLGYDRETAFDLPNNILEALQDIKRRNG